MNPGVAACLEANLKALKLTTIAREFESEARQAREAGLDYLEFLLGLTEKEALVRGENRLKRRLREARFPLLKTLDGFDFSAAPGLEPRKIQELAGGEYLKYHQNILLIGKSGTGKTHLATALGVEACRQGISTRFVTACGLANELVEARDERILARTTERYGRYGLLIVDEMGYIPLSKEGGQLFFQVLARRHERASTIITTNLGLGEWTQVFGDAHLTAALLDRLTHKATILTCDWESFRLRETLQLKNRGKG